MIDGGSIQCQSSFTVSEYKSARITHILLQVGTAIGSSQLQHAPCRRALRGDIIRIEVLSAY